MSKMSRHNNTALEVTIMFEPHRLQHDLLQRAYALLVPLPPRRLAAPEPSSVPPRVQPQEGAERSVS
jgi:hypothetical protein